MLTQQDLINRLNQLTLRYNLTWFDIKYDADKAINKINSFMGTKYPKISSIMETPNSTYAIPTFSLYAYDYNTEQYKASSIELLQELVTDAGGDTPMVEDNIYKLYDEAEIIKEEYFHSVIIPYIAMEVLARDEEFTTIYNKYATEMNDGLFDMFQREFNNVPFEFRQNPGEGVFFGIDTALGKMQHNQRDLNVPTFKFKVTYYPNNNEISLTQTFIRDVKAYVYDQAATILYPPSTYYYSEDGSKAFTFKAWSRDRGGVNTITGTYTEVVGTPTLVKMRADLNLFATWDSFPTLLISSSGIVTINIVHRPNLINLVIPEYVNGIQVITIPTSFVSANAPTTDLFTGAIYLPNSVDVISLGGFAGFKGERIQLNEGITYIGASAFSATPNLKEIIIPASVTDIAIGAFPVVAGKHLVIKARVLEANKPNGWLNGWYANSDPAQNYSVEIIWGYNGA